VLVVEDFVGGAAKAAALVVAVHVHGDEVALAVFAESVKPPLFFGPAIVEPNLQFTDSVE
jgi:hypothetical protein